MQINISTRHGHISSQTQEKITEKLQRLSRFFDRITAMDLTIDLEHKETPSVELRVSAEHTNDFVATTEGDLMVAVDAVYQKMEQQLRKHKEKKTGHRAPGWKGVETPQSTPE